ncbi:hypothetical protein F5Y14DRAFT_128693 [Nemania sp. NC0429]|nr:hypothetical protein F5Y14DRAFT_128693 [Nemania sp. NC0429]
MNKCLNILVRELQYRGGNNPQWIIDIVPSAGPGWFPTQNHATGKLLCSNTFKISIPPTGQRLLVTSLFSEGFYKRTAPKATVSLTALRVTFTNAGS